MNRILTAITTLAVMIAAATSAGIRGVRTATPEHCRLYDR